jgi:hypothetical protein
MQPASVRRLGTFLGIAGAALALSMAVLLSWADFEGLSYFATGAGYDQFSGLRCPSIISTFETAPVSVRFGNQSGKDIEPHYRVQISGKTTFRELQGSVAVPAHESREVKWDVSAADADLTYFVLVKLTVLPVTDGATREATCGILILDLGHLSGSAALTLAVLASVLFSIGGLILPAVLLDAHERVRYDAEAPLPSRRAVQALGITTAAALLPALAGSWLVAWILCVIGLLLLLIVLRDALS